MIKVFNCTRNVCSCFHFSVVVFLMGIRFQLGSNPLFITEETQVPGSITNLLHVFLARVVPQVADSELRPPHDRLCSTRLFRKQRRKRMISLECTTTAPLSNISRGSLAHHRLNRILHPIHTFVNIKQVSI